MIEDDDHIKSEGIQTTDMSDIEKPNAKENTDTLVDSIDIDLSEHQSAVMEAPLYQDNSDISKTAQVDNVTVDTVNPDIHSAENLDNQTADIETVIPDDELLATVPKKASQTKLNAGLPVSKEMSQTVPKIGLLLLGLGVLFGGLVWWMITKTPESEIAADGADTEVATKSDNASPPVQQIKKPSYFKNEVVLDKLTLQRPPIGEGHVLTENQIGWCLYQKIRINELRSFLREGSAIMTLNERTKEYNDSCSNFQYSKASLKIIQKELQPHLSQIKSMAQTEAVALDKQARNNDSQQIEASNNLDPVPLTASKPTIMPKVSLPVADKPLLPNNECAVVVQSYSKVSDARHYIKTALTSRKYVKILQMKNGKYAVSLGTLKPTELNVLSQWKASQVIPASSSCMKADMFIKEMPLTKEAPIIKKAPLIAKNPSNKKLIRKTNDADTANQATKQGTDNKSDSAINKVNNKAVTYITNNPNNANANPSNNAMQSSNDLSTGQASQGATLPSANSAYTDDGLSTGYFQEGTLTESEQSVAQSRNQKEIDNLLRNYTGAVNNSELSTHSQLSDIQSSTNMSDASSVNTSKQSTGAASESTDNDSSDSGGLSLTEGEPLNDADASQLLNQSE